MEANMDVIKPGLFPYFIPDDGDEVPVRKGYFDRHPSRLASIYMKPLILNIEGIIQYFSGSHQEALQQFEKALQLDPDNLNSLENCAYVYEKVLNCQSKAKDARAKICEILSSPDAPVAQARCLAEQGRIHLRHFAMLKYSRHLLKHAIVIAQSTDGKIDTDELAYWKFVLASYILENCTGETLIKEGFFLLCEIASNETVGSILKAYVLHEIGYVLLMHQYLGPQYMQTLLKVVHENELDLSNDLHDYLSKAHELQPNNAHIAHTFAEYLMRNKKQLEEAEKVIEAGMQALQPQERYHLIFCARGELRLKQYQRLNKHQPGYGGKHWLEEAKQDLIYCSKYEPTTFAYGLLGTVCHLLLMHDDPLVLDSEKEQEALSHFHTAVSLLHGDRNTQTHLHYAMCLEDFGYLRQAVESFKRAVESDNLKTPSTFFMYKLITSLIQLYKFEKRAEFIMGELIFWMNFTCKKYNGLDDHLKKTFVQLKRERSIMTELYHNLRKNHHEETASLFHRYIPRFSTWCPFQPNVYSVHPALVTSRNFHKPYDFLVVFADAQKPWVFYSLLTKLEQQYGFKGCLFGRDLITAVSADTAANGSAAVNAATATQEAEENQQKDIVSSQDLEEDIMVDAFAKCACIITVETADLFESIWFHRPKVKETLRQYATKETGIIRLLLEESSDDNQENHSILPENPHLKHFDITDYCVPWEIVVRELKKCFQDNEERHYVRSDNVGAHCVSSDNDGVIITLPPDFEILHLGF